MDLELFKSLSKYPFILEKELYDSVELNQNKTCLEKCKEKDCFSLIENKEDYKEYICSKGYNNVLKNIGDFKFILNGLIFQDNSTVPIGRKDARKEWIVDKNSVEIFLNKIEQIEQHLVRRINETTEKNFSMFHDFKTSMSIFYNCTHDIINQLPGDTFAQKLENSDKSYQDLYNSLDLITSQLGMMDVIINPSSIYFGNKRQINIFKLFQKIKILFGHLSTKKKDVNIILTSEVYVEDCYCYESIEFIPLILLDNALKYSTSERDVEIKFEHHYGVLKVIVKSVGPLVSDEDQPYIFDKFYRGESGKKFSKEGIGMGLWIVQQILKAHNCELRYHKSPFTSGNVGLNIFEFELPIITT